MRSAGYHEKTIGRTYFGGDPIKFSFVNTIKWPYQLKHCAGPETIKKSRAWIGAQLTILCSINRKLRSGDYKEIGVRFLGSV